MPRISQFFGIPSSRASRETWPTWTRFLWSGQPRCVGRSERWYGLAAGTDGSTAASRSASERDGQSAAAPIEPGAPPGAGAAADKARGEPSEREELEERGVREVLNR